jgi:hypothetical protein
MVWVEERRPELVMKRIKILIMGAVGRDFHNFNMMFRHDPSYEVAGNPKQPYNDRTEVFGYDVHALVLGGACAAWKFAERT